MVVSLGKAYRCRTRLFRSISAVLNRLLDACTAARPARRACAEPLEDRRLLSITPIISEFMANNSQTLDDEDGNSPDWIEIYNPSASAVNLAGYHLTDNPDNLDKWTFPSVSIGGTQNLVVFASEKDRIDPAGPLHTNFKLADDGGYLALVAPDGLTILHEYGTAAEPRVQYPRQLLDVSYGVAINVTRQTLLTTSADVRVQVPQDDLLGLTWTTLDFDHSAWTAGRTGVGYEGDPPIIPAVGFTARMVDVDGDIQSIADARAILNGTAPAGSFNVTASTAAIRPVVHFGYGGDWGTPYMLPDGNARGDQYALRITSDLIIPAGNWSLRIKSDQGFILTMPGVNFLSRSGEDYTGTPWNSATVPSDTAVYGITRDDGSTTVTFTVPAGGLATRLTLDAFDDVTADDSLELLVAPGFAPTKYFMVAHNNYGWALSTIGPGTLPYANLIQTNVGTAMRNQNASALLRLPFGFDLAQDFDALNLRMRYDDGFVAFINGVRVAGSNAPELLEWNSTATAEHPSSLAVNFEDFTIPIAGLLQTGGNVLAIQGLNLSASDVDFLIYPQLEALKISVGGQRFFQRATPNAINDTSGLTQSVGDTAYSHDRGFYDAPFDVSISSTTPAAAIRYTLDGTAPTPTYGTVYTGPIHIERTTTIRAISYASGFIPTNVDTQTYLFLSDVVNQASTNAAPPGWPTSWGSNTVDYGMDPTVVAPSPAVAVLPNGKTVFTAFAPATGQEPYITDGTAAGTFLLKDILSGTGSSGAGAFVTAGNYVYFRAGSGSADHELWRTDGTASGTVRVQDIKTGSGSYPNGLVAVGNVVYFAADDGSTGYELWKSVSTTDTTSRVKDVNGAGSSYPSNLTNVNGTLYFTANTSAYGWELYKSDGTDAGTVLVKDIRSGSASSSPMRLTAVGSTLFFTADDGSTGYELWKSNGTSAGTVRLADISPGINGSFPNELKDVGGTLYFAAYQPATGMELWKSDGTTATLVKDINPGAEGSSPKGLANFNGVLAFTADEPVNGRELWRSGGAAGSTLLVRDIRPGPRGSKPENLTVLGTTLYFSADDGSNGFELWQTNGSTGNASMAADIVAGDKGSSPAFLTVANGNLIFTTDEDDENQRLRKWAPGTGLSTLSALAIERDAGLVQNDMLAIPTLSIVMKLGDLFDSATGIYANPGRDYGDGVQWEKPMSLELINPDGSTGFQIDAGLRIRGGFSRSTDNPKHAFRVFFKSEYGDGKLNYPMFGEDGADSFDGFDLRTFQNYSWSFGGSNQGIFMRDMVNRDMQLATGQPAERGDFYHLYINGVYWGIYNTAERPEASYGESYFGGRKEDYDVIKQSTDGGHYTLVTDGNMDAWTSLWNQARGNMTVAANYQKLLGNNADGTRNRSYPVLVDIDNLIDYMLVIYYGGNLDAPLSNFLSNTKPNNYFAIRNRLGEEGFRFFVHDAEHTLLNVNEDRTGPYLTYAGVETSNPQYLFQLFGANAEFRLRVADRMNKWFNNDGAMSPTGAAALLAKRQREITNAVYAESARWGDAKTEPARTRQQDWITELNRVFQSYLPTRTSIVFNQLKADGYYPNVAAPLFSQFGGEIGSGFRLAISRPGTSGVIYYTTDGTDPRAVNGAVRGTAYTESLILTSAATVRARVLDNGVWSALTEASFTYDLGDLRITEIMYNPALPPNLPPDSTWTRNDFEWLEVQNTGTGGIALGGAYFTDGIRFHFPAATLAPGAYGLIVADQEAFEWLYGAGLPILGEFELDDEGNRTQLSDGGEVLDLRSADGDKVIEFEYKDTWHPITDGGGFSLVAERPTDGRDEFDTSAAWRPSFRRGGTPAAPDDGYATGAIIVSELLANSTAADPGDWAEFRNTTGQDIDISGWFLSDAGSDLRKYTIPAGTIIPAGQYLVFTQAQHFGAAFVFDNIGESVRLTSSDNGLEGGFRISESFGASDADVSFGLYTKSTGNTDFVALLSTTRGLPNAAARIGPIVISEIMYNPAAGGDEYIELKNISTGTVSLSGWQFAGVTLSFDASASLAAGKYGLVVGIDPATFRTKYSVDAAVPVWQWTASALDNGGEAIEISRPGPVSDTIIPYILADRVKYQDGGDWPSQPDGNGPSLVRLPVTAYGNDAARWTYGPVGGTPGGDPAVRTGRTSTDIYTLRLDPTGLNLQFFENVSASAAPTLAVPVGQYSTISIDLVSGAGDTLIIDLTYGNPVPSGGIFYNGGTTTGSSGADVLRITGGSGNDWIMAADGRVLVGSSFVSFTGVESVFIDGNDGNDTLGISGPISYSPTITGGNGTDRLLVTGTSGDDAIRLTASQLIFGTGTATFSGMETYQVDGTQGADTLTVPGSLAFNPTFNGGNGDDRLVIEGAMTVQPVFNGGDGFDSFTFAGTSGNDSFTIEPTRLLFGALSIGLNAINLVTIDGGEGADTLTITGPLTASIQFNGGGSADSIIINGATTADVLTVSAGQILYGTSFILLDQVDSLRFNGGAGDDQFTVGIIPIPVIYDGGTGINRLTVVGTGLADQVTLASGLVTAGALSLSYGSVGQLQVDTLGGDDTITVPAALSIGQAYNLGDGNDTLRLLGTASTDTFTAAAASITRNGLAIPFNSAETVRLDGDAAGDYFTLPITLPYTLEIDGNSGDDSGTVTGTAGADELTVKPGLVTGPGLRVVLLQIERLQFDGNAGNDQFTVHADVPYYLTFNGSTGDTDRLTIVAAAAGSTLSVTASQITGMAQPLSYNSAEDLRILGSAGNDSVTLANILAYAPFISLGAGNDTLAINAGTWSFGPELTAGGDGLALALAGGTVSLNASTNLRALSIATDTRINLAANGSRLLRTGSLAIDGAGVLDLVDNDLIVGTDGSAAAITAVEALFFAGRNGGAWNGSGITASSLAGQSLLTLAMMPNRDGAGQPLLSSFAGQPVDANCVLFKRTTHGDLDLNGRLDGDDYFLMDLGYLAGRTGWRGGDVNYSGGPANGADYFLTDLGFLRQSPPAAPASTPFATTVPIVPLAPVLAAPLLGASLNRADDDVFSDELVEVLG